MLDVSLRWWHWPVVFSSVVIVTGSFVVFGAAPPNRGVTSGFRALFCVNGMNERHGDVNHIVYMTLSATDGLPGLRFVIMVVIFCDFVTIDGRLLGIKLKGGKCQNSNQMTDDKMTNCCRNLRLEDSSTMMAAVCSLAHHPIQALPCYFNHPLHPMWQERLGQQPLSASLISPMMSSVGATAASQSPPRGNSIQQTWRHVDSWWRNLCQTRQQCIGYQSSSNETRRLGKLRYSLCLAGKRMLAIVLVRQSRRDE